MENPAKVAAATQNPNWEAFESKGYDHTVEEALLHLRLSSSTCGHGRHGRRELAPSLCDLVFQLMERFQLTGVAPTSDPPNSIPELIDTAADLRNDQRALVAETLSLWQPVDGYASHAAVCGSPTALPGQSRPPRPPRRATPPSSLGGSAGWPGGSA